MTERVFDLLVSALALFVLGPLILLLAGLIKLDSRGPVFFKQWRVGRDGVLFQMYKFRKFHHGSGTGGPGLSLRRDGRLTSVGRFLETYKLNELPQFLNVLKGDMSVVGPRPETPDFVQKYRDEYSRILGVKQGVFGVNQRIFLNESALLPEYENVESFYLEQLLPVKMENDLEYIRKKNLFHDIAVLGRCIWAVLAQPLKRRFSK